MITPALERQYWRTLEVSAPDSRFREQYQAFRVATEFKGLSKNQQRDFDYYLSKGRQERCYPSFQSPPSPDKLVFVAHTPELWYWLFDTHGIRVTCIVETDSGAIVQAKAFLNLTIKNWVEDVLNHPLFPSDVTPGFFPLPWVKEAFLNQLHRELMTKIGFIPTWTKPFWNSL